MNWTPLAFVVAMVVTCLASTTSSTKEVTENEADILLFTQQYQEVDCSLNFFTIADTAIAKLVNISHVIRETNGLCLANVTLVEPLDFETTSELKMAVFGDLDCATGNELRRIQTWTILVIDAKDTPPQFLQDPYNVTVPEDFAVGQVIVPNITAIDEESGDFFQYIINLKESQKSMFEAKTKLLQTTNREVMDVFLRSPLDYETARQHTFTVIANDSMGNHNTVEVIINVKDVQDMPPYFISPLYNARVNESAPKGTHVISVSARDGDGPNVTNVIEYSIDGSSNMFAINDSTGEITTSGRLDIDNKTEVQNGLAILTILAKEISPAGTSQKGETTATATVQIQVDDVNDNPPRFGASSYMGTTREDAVVGELVSLEGGGYIFVTDIDQAASNNRFTLHTEKDGVPWDVFQPNIRSQFWQASVVLYVAQPEKLKGFGNKHIIFQLVATDTSQDTIGVRSSVAEITVWISARATPAPPPQAIVDLPLSTSDIFVFVVGVLLILNIVFTVIVCRLLNRNRGEQTPVSVLGRRNSKYYVSGRKSRDNIEAANASNDTHINQTPNNDTVTPGKVTIILDNNHSSDQGLSTVDKNRCDVTPIHGKPVPGTNPSEATSADQLFSLLDGSTKPLQCDVTPMQPTTSSNTGVKAKTIPLNNEGEPNIQKPNGLSSILQKVQKKLGESNPYVPDRKSDDGDLRPLHVQQNSLDSTSTEEGNSSGSSFSTNTTTCDVAPFINSSKNASQKPSSHPSMKTQPTTSQTKPPASQRQLTETGVPQVALTLPIAKSAMPKETVSTVKNPVYNEGLPQPTKPIIKNTLPSGKRNPAFVIDEGHQNATGSDRPKPNYVQAAKSLLTKATSDPKLETNDEAKKASSSGAKSTNRKEVGETPAGKRTVF